MCVRFFLLLFVGFGLLGCRGRGQESEQEIRYVKTAKVSAVDYVDREFAGMSTADDATTLAFKIAGQVAGVDVSKGQYVKKGELLARLDPRDVELQVAADKSQYVKALSQYERMKQSWNEIVELFTGILPVNAS